MSKASHGQSHDCHLFGVGVGGPSSGDDTQTGGRVDPESDVWPDIKERSY